MSPRTGPSNSFPNCHHLSHRLFGMSQTITKTHDVSIPDFFSAKTSYFIRITFATIQSIPNNKTTRTAMTTTATPSKPPASWALLQIPKPIQTLFNKFPLVTYPSNDLPLRTQLLNSSSLPTLYIFTTEPDALANLPSFNPTCLKWQTLLRLTRTPHRVLPSTNHASPTGSLPFLLPADSTSSPSKPIPASRITNHLSLALPPPPTAREETFLSLLTPIRNAFLYSLYLLPSYEELLNQFYIYPSTSSSLVQKTLRYQLRSAAAASILQSKNLHPDGGKEQIDEKEIFEEVREALEALAGELLQSRTEWFFGRERPGEFDAGVFGYLWLMLVYMGGGLGQVVREVGGGVLERFCRRIAEECGWDL
ncbi:hypothetical protein QBC38DRAFT_485194 [Podospora fimiseda]|uniref:Thioredoxin-like fold domain-containing protein n=1 Tax=Podospora fimiseda TaxID=252190 RepID=A0AAN7H009_9PEZI|nr:hypothetical protein QBC38DRAFT_485194 [Podospora fimiseda]